MMTKKVTYTNVTPIPSFIPRQLAIDILHSHGEVIELNPLVTGWEAIKSPREAPAEEFYSTWYEIAQRIQYIPGMGRLGSGGIKFKGVFHDMPWGLQTHIYAPAGVDLRNKWQICGNQPGEPAQTHEMGIGAPPEGLYLREDIEIKCNVAMISFVKKENKAAARVLVERLIKKAELLDAGMLQGMMKDGKLKTVNPADKRAGYNQVSPQSSPKQPYQLPNSPMSPSHVTACPQQSDHYVPPNQLLGSNDIVMELPGDFTYPQRSSGHLHPSDSRHSTTSDGSMRSPTQHDSRWSQTSHDNHSSTSSRPSSYTPSEGMRSPVPEQKSFAAELPTTEESNEQQEKSGRKRGGSGAAKVEKYQYNPNDYAKIQQLQQERQKQQQQQSTRPPQYSAYHPPGR